MSNYILLIPIILIIIIIIVVAISLIKKSKESNETPSSILDVNEVGVPSSSEFSYGYEKEATVVMNPIDVEKEEEIKLPEEKEVESQTEDAKIEESEEK